MARDVAVLVNPAAGKGRAPELADAVATRLSAAGDEVRMIAGRSAEESLALARQAVVDGADVIVAVGGDGLTHLALQAVAGTGTVLGLVPSGTGNDIARAVGLPPDDPQAAADTIARGAVTAVDAIRVTTADGDVTWVGTILAVGFDAKVNARSDRMRWLPSALRYNTSVFAELASFRPISYVLDIDNEQIDLDAMLIAVGNAPWYGKGMKMCPDASITDGLLDLTIVHPVSRATLVRIFPTVYPGKHVDHPNVETRTARSISITATGIVAYADGERIGALPLTAEAVPGAVNVLVPPPA